MSLTLGDKLRQAREARGITISDVAEQTRISRLYLECIENNDYRSLPGGIFNKGFVKSYAKFVGIDEQEALQDYSKLIIDQGEGQVEEVKTYRPEVLTDDRSGGSMLPTLIIAAVILGLLSWGIISLVNYINAPKEVATNTATANSNTKPGNANANGNAANANTSTANTVPQTMPTANELKVEFKALVEPIALVATVDGKKEITNVQPDTPLSYTAQQSVRFGYYRGFTPDKIQLTVNGKIISTPTAPAMPKRNSIEFEINKENIQQIWQSGVVTVGTPPAPNANTANANVANTTPR
jgi:cytoskeletal protein RodZ